MKRFLLLLIIGNLFLTKQAQSQDVIVMNEFYTDPGKSTNEFFELYNSSLKPVNLDNYSLLLFYDDNTGKGFYVIDFPSVTVATNSYYTASNLSPFSVQANVPVTPNLNYSTILNATSGDSYLKKYVLNTPQNAPAYFSSTATDITAAELSNIIKKRSGSQAQYHALIYDGESLVNFFIGGYSTIPSYVAAWPSLTVPCFTASGNTLTKTFNFSQLIANNGESVISTPGNDNGYRRTRDGQCGTWVKGSSGSEHTPGYTNGATSNIGSLTVTASMGLAADAGPSTLFVSYNVLSSSDATVWPVTVRIVNDYGTDQPGDAVNESKLPEGPFVPYNAQDMEELASFGNPNPKYDYPLATFTSGSGAARSYLTSPAITPLAYMASYTGTTRQRRAFHVFFQAASGCFDQVRYVATEEAKTLPVSFKSFTVKRNKQNVVLNWQTTTEQNNAGFTIERNINGNWTEIAFVASQATGGNSNSDLNYSYLDLNSHKGISQYRIRQNDLDAKMTYSVIRSVQGEGAGPKLVIYPNPSTDGRVQMVFEDANSARHIVISDMSGRIVRQYSNVLNSSMTIDGLSSGLFTARVINQATGESTLQKFVIQQK